MQKPLEQATQKNIEELGKIWTAIKTGESKWSDYLEDVDSSEHKNESFEIRLENASVVKKSNAPQNKDDPDKSKLLIEIEKLKTETGINDITPILKPLLNEQEQGVKLINLPVDKLELITKTLNAVLERKRK